MAGNQIITGVNVTGNLTANDISVVIGNQPLDPLPKNIRFNVEKPIQTFTGRESFLEDLHKVVKEGQITVLTQAPISVVAATGGIGKTETVRMYIQLHAHEYDNVIWIDAEDNSSAKNQFIQLAIKLNISTDFGGKPKELDLIRDQIFEILLRNAHVVLLVFDNAEAFEDDQDLNLNGIRSLLPKSLSPFFVEPTVIVTSRNQNWSLQNVIQLDLWTEGEVVAFVVKRLDLEETSENNKLATYLGNLFGRLPIALQAAVAVILQQIKRKKKYGIQNLIDEYERGSRKVLAQKPLNANMRPTRIGDTMLVLWNILFEKIVKFPDGKLALKILCSMAYLSPKRIPQDFLFALFEKDFAQDLIENALEILGDFSLIVSLDTANSESHSFSIHRMIQDVIIEKLRTNQGQRQRVIFNESTFLNETDVLLKLSAESINYIKTLDTRKIRRGNKIVENLVHIINHVLKKLDVKEFRDWTMEIAHVLRYTNKLTKCIELYERVLETTPALDFRNQIMLKRVLAVAYSEGGFVQKSIAFNQEIIDYETIELGILHGDIFGAKCAIAHDLHELGKYDEAAGKFSEILQDFRNIQDNKSESFLSTKHSYALLLSSQGKTEEALKLLTEVLKEYEKNPDLNSESLIKTKENIAAVLKEQGKFEEASAMMLQNISDATRVFGPFNLDTFTFELSYAKLLGDQGKLREATQLYSELLDREETELGSEHPLTLSTKSLLACFYIDSEELDKALPLLDIEVFERVFGPEHLETMSVANNLAAVMSKQGKFGEAFLLLNKAFEISKQVLGPNHPTTLRTMYNIGFLHCKIKEYDEGAELFQNVLLRQEEVLGKNHPETMNTLKVLTICRNLLDKRKDLIVNFMKLTSVDVEIGRSILEASNWNMEAALDLFFNPNFTEAFIPSRIANDFHNETLDVIPDNSTNGN